MGWILVGIIAIIDYFIIKSTIKSYRKMKEAKAKAEAWGGL